MKVNIIVLAAFLSVGSLLGITAIALIAVYAFQNKSHHTGAEPYLSFILFVPLAITGAVSLRRSGSTGTLALTVGILGIGLVIWLDQTNLLVEYQRWIDRGMP